MEKAKNKKKKWKLGKHETKRNPKWKCKNDVGLNGKVKVVALSG